MSNRLSFGGNRTISALRDGSSLQNTMRSSSAPRRRSFGISCPSTPVQDYSASGKEESGKKDRRALLEEWRRQRGESPSITDEIPAPPTTSNKRPKLQPREVLPKPSGTYGSSSSNSNAFITAGETSLERYRMKKLQKLQQENHFEGSLFPPRPNANRPYTHEDDDSANDNHRGTASTLSSGTPLVGRHLGAARRRTFSSNNTSFLSNSPMTQETEGTITPFTHLFTTHFCVENNSDFFFFAKTAGSSKFDQTMSQITVQSQPTPRREEDLDLVEEADLRSRVREMQLRVEQLEREKMVLSMANAPLEARYRQKEDNWAKEQNRLLQEIESLKNASREADERYRDLEMKHELTLDECRQLREACRKASSLRPAEAAETSSWSRRLQTDRDVAELKEMLRHAEDEMKDLRLVKVSVEKELNATKIEFDSLLRNYDELHAEYDEIASSKSASRDAEIKLEHLTTEHIATSAQLNAVCADLAATKARAEAGMRAKDEDYKREIAQLQFEMSVLKTRAGRAEDNQRSAVPTDVEDEAVLRARIEERDRRIAELQAELLKGEQIRRQMHNRIQELRGNIRVFVRTRPFLPADGHSNQSSIDVLPDGESLSIIDSRNSNPHAFKFDKVFPPSAGQDMVFSEVSDFVQSALDGYHVCLFSYGQTGSGKTHTMQGSGNGVMRGIIPRAVEQVLSQAHALQKQSWEFKMTASFLEIYNEDLKDLLISMNGSSSQTRNGAKLSIKRNAEGKSYVEGLTEIPIETFDPDAGLKRLDALMAVAARSRSTASTKMNSQSSRSHSVFMLHLRGHNSESGTTVDGALNLCDLAGSERLDRSGAGSDAQRLRETQAINKSLSCLGDVFNALATGAAHVPYRNSKLTYLLQDCLSGDGKALMFVNLSPTVASSNESLCSLRFAQRVNQVELGKPTKHIQYSKTGK